jgi:hypothetical protein
MKGRRRKRRRMSQWRRREEGEEERRRGGEEGGGEEGGGEEGGGRGQIYVLPAPMKVKKRAPMNSDTPVMGGKHIQKGKEER